VAAGTLLACATVSAQSGGMFPVAGAETMSADGDDRGVQVHKSDSGDVRWGWVLGLYLIAVGGLGGLQYLRVACLCEDGKSSECTLELAAWAGLLGGFLHGAQSLVHYMGNGSLRRTWALWYLLRPLQGAVVGTALYVIARAGLISGAGQVNIYGVSALGLLGGWFSKNAADKMKEVFETLFGKGADDLRNDKVDKKEAEKVSRGAANSTDGVAPPSVQETSAGK